MQISTNSTLHTLLSCLLVTGIACDGGAGDGEDSASETGDSGEAGEAGEESEEGTDDGDLPPPDTDEDGLNDEEEAELGTDPNKKDTDDDTYWDSWEVTEGTDPLDPESRIYVGYWPYNPDKDDMVDPGWGSSDVKPQVGGLVPRFSMEDHYGEQVDIYDYAGHDQFAVLDFSTVWCPPCNSISGWLSGKPEDVQQWEPMYPSVDDKVHDGTIHWVTIIAENQGGGNAAPSDGQAWAAAYPDEVIPVLVDQDKVAANTFVSFGWPTLMIVDPKMEVNYFPTMQDPWGALRNIDLYLD